MRNLLVPHEGDLDDTELAELLAYPELAGARPWVRANMVSTADGAGAGPDGRSASISGPPDRAVFGLLRALCDVVVVGWSTARAEHYAPYDVKPRWRGLRSPEQAPHPVTAVVSTTLDLDLSAPLFADSRGRTLVLTSDSSPQEARRRAAERVDVLVVGERTVDPREAVAALAARGLTRVLCEGGPRLLASVAAAQVLDELCLTVSPLLTAGDARRILDGPVLAPVQRLRLTRLLEEDGFLFPGYVRD